MGVLKTVTCPECGTSTRTDLTKGRLEGLCPGCLVAVAAGSPAVVTTRVPQTPIAALPPEVAKADPSTRLGKFVTVAKLGAGSSGEVWKAWDTGLGRWVALKVFHEDDADELARFTREAETAAKISHPNIAAIYDVGSEKGRHFLAMQYVEGVTLQKFPRRNVKLLVRIIRDAARAVAEAHRMGIVHRDLKPANLAVATRGENPAHAHVYVLDFGLARRIEGGDKVTATGIVVGTPAYMSPEQARGEHVDGRADVYALGATLYELLTRRPVFRGSSVYELLRKVEDLEPPPPRRLVSSIPRDVETIVLKCLEKDPARRYGTCTELAEELDRYLNGNPIEARAPSALYRIRMRIKKRKALTVAAITVAALLVMAAWLVPAWRSEATARAKWEERRLQVERARPHLEAGRVILHRMKLRVRADYTREELKSLAAQAHECFNRSLELAPDSAEALWGRAVAFGMTREQDAALEAVERSIQGDEKYAPSYLERVRLLLDKHCTDQVSADDEAVFRETPESRKILSRIESDLGKVERYSKDYPQQKYAKALLAFVRGEYGQAADSLRIYLEHETEDARAHLWRGLALIQLDQSPSALTAALDEFTKALTWDTQDPNASSMRGRIKLALGRCDEAIGEMSKAIEWDEKDAAAYHVRGWARLKKKDFEEAIRDFSTAINLKPAGPHSFNLRGVARGELGRHNEAIADFSKAIDLKPGWAQAYSNRGETWKKLRRYELAMEDHHKAIEVDPSYKDAYINRGRLKSLLKNTDAAIKDFNKVLDLDPRNTQALFHRGVTRSKQDPKGAIQDFTSAIDIDPKFALAYSLRGMLRLPLPDKAGALQDCDKAVALDPTSGVLRAHRGSVRQELNDIPGAREDYDKAIDLEPRDPLGYGYRSEFRRELGDSKGAIEDCDKLIALGHGNTLVYSCRGYAHYALNKHAEAIEDFEQVTKLDPKDANAHYFRGYAHLKVNNCEKGIRDLETALQLFSTPAERANAAIGIAWGHLLKGHKSQSLDWLEKAIGLGFKDLTWIEFYLGSLRAEEQYKQVVDRLKHKPPKKDY
jgi:tetratricopeptide (TPR) repeat protein/tRNA A-37 threonylcarbamoyl transferase component Bud32